MSVRSSIGGLVALALCAGSSAAGAQELDGESFAALAYLRVPFSAKPYFGVTVEKDRVEASRPAARDYEPLWLRPKVIDLHLDPQNLQPLRINGRKVHGGGSRSLDDIAWSARIDR